jgi:hypothetical protein
MHRPCDAARDAPGPPCHTPKTPVDRRGVSLTHTADYRSGQRPRRSTASFSQTIGRMRSLRPPKPDGCRMHPFVLLEGTIILHPPAVTPAQAGSSSPPALAARWIPACAGMTPSEVHHPPMHRHPQAKTRGPIRSLGRSPHSPMGPRVAAESTAAVLRPPITPWGGSASPRRDERALLASANDR